jgi:hypothetical protein
MPDFSWPDEAGSILQAAAWAAFALIGAGLEVVRKRVPGWRAGLGLAAGLALSGWRGGGWGPPAGLMPSLLAAGVAFGLFYGLRRAGGVEAGVPPWAAALAALASGGRLALAALLYGALCGLPLALLALARRGELKAGLGRALRGGARFRYEAPTEDAAPRISYAAALAGGVLLALWRYA